MNKKFIDASEMFKDKKNMNMIKTKFIKNVGMVDDDVNKLMDDIKNVLYDYFMSSISLRILSTYIRTNDIDVLIIDEEDVFPEEVNQMVNHCINLLIKTKSTKVNILKYVTSQTENEYSGLIENKLNDLLKVIKI